MPVLHLVLASSDIDVSCALTTCPPASSFGTSLSISLGVERIETIGPIRGRGITWDGTPINFVIPRIDLGTIGGWDTVRSRVIGLDDGSYKVKMSALIHRNLNQKHTFW